MNEAFLLWHVHELSDGEDDEKLIGVYRTEEDAQSAIEQSAARFCWFVAMNR